MKKFLLIPLLLMLVVLFSGCSSDDSGDSNNISDLENRVEGVSDSSDAELTVYFFWGDGCPHCETQKPFMEEMKEKYPELEVKSYETWKNPENAKLFQEVAKNYGIEARGVPATFIGDFEPIVGFNNSMRSGIEEKIKTCLEEGCINPSEK